MFLKIKCIAHIGLHEDAYWHNLMSLNLVYSGRSCDFNRQGGNTKRVRMFQPMPLQYFKDDRFNRGRFKMTQNDPSK